MSTDTADQIHLPLTRLSEDERLFREQVRQFAEEKVRPRKKGGIDFAATDDDAAQGDDDEDLSGYMHPDDVPDREPKK